MGINLKRRLAKLEHIEAGDGRFIVVIGPEDLDVRATLEQRGIVEAPDDLIVSVSKLPSSEVRVTIDGKEAA